MPNEKESYYSISNYYDYRMHANYCLCRDDVPNAVEIANHRIAPNIF